MGDDLIVKQNYAVDCIKPKRDEITVKSESVQQNLVEKKQILEDALDKLRHAEQVRRKGR